MSVGKGVRVTERYGIRSENDPVTLREAYDSSPTLQWDDSLRWQEGKRGIVLQIERGRITRASQAGRALVNFGCYGCKRDGRTCCCDAAKSLLGFG